jgi:antitoxin component YwqK of YwqJK toxin-antitoxin module
LRAEANFRDDKEEGVCRGFYENGILRLEGNYENGALEGISKTYYSNGEIQYIDTYKKGQKINSKAYDEEGNLESDQDYPYVKQD